MKILIDAHVFDGSFQGSRTYIQGIYRAMIPNNPNWEFHFLGHDTNLLRTTFGEAPNVFYHKLNYHNKYLRLLWEIPRFIRKHKIDYTHFQYITPLWKTVKYIVTTHDILFEEDRFKHYFPAKYKAINGFLFRRSAKQAAVLTTVSKYSKQKLHELYGLPLDSIYVTPNGVSEVTSQKSERYIQEKFGCEKYLLYVSRIEPRKNHLSLLKAFVNLKLYEQGYQLVFIGFYDIQSKALQEYMEAHKAVLRNHVRFYSNIGGEDIHQFYFNAELFLYPSYAEGFGIPPLEAAVHEVPVICSNATAMKAFDFFGHHIDPTNQDELESAIVDALSGKTDDLIRTKALVLKQFDWALSARVLQQALLADHAKHG